MLIRAAFAIFRMIGAAIPNSLARSKRKHGQP
jgi:hypothetical protein